MTTQTTEKNPQRKQFLALVEEAEREASRYIQLVDGPAVERPSETSIIRAKTGKVIRFRDTLIEKPFGPTELEQLIDLYPRATFLKLVRTSIKLDIDKHLRSFQGTTNPIVKSAYFGMCAFDLLCLCCFARRTKDLTAEELFVVGHNVGVMRMALRHSSDEHQQLQAQKKHDSVYKAKRRAIVLLGELAKKFPNEPRNPGSKRSCHADRAVKILEVEGFGAFAPTVIAGWWRSFRPRPRGGQSKA